MLVSEIYGDMQKPLLDLEGTKRMRSVNGKELDPPARSRNKLLFILQLPVSNF